LAERSSKIFAFNMMTLPKICNAGQCNKIHLAQKLHCTTGCRTQAVHKVADTPAIGAQISGGSHEPSLIDCLIIINIFGTHSAVKSMRIYSSRFLT
jgi:hypothetical protein